MRNAIMVVASLIAVWPPSWCGPSLNSPLHYTSSLLADISNYTSLHSAFVLSTPLVFWVL
ncbi:hypothetical protein CUMW_218160 [Citrus unshiu]|uniref:Uncharacterized protein n=1 Tax=Citrus unshiu TaxID=55188 RepID=A0A2H5QD17_CITUN|nr:hypothetical protein CUMW_218160 [Citrus unshiu]